MTNSELKATEGRDGTQTLCRAQQSAPDQHDSNTHINFPLKFPVYMLLIAAKVTEN